MSQILEDYRRRLQAEGAVLHQEAEARCRLGHLHAFKFGRSIGRIENARNDFSLRVRWLLLGAALGVTVAVVYVRIFLSERFLPFVK